MSVSRSNAEEEVGWLFMYSRYLALNKFKFLWRINLILVFQTFNPLTPNHVQQTLSPKANLTLNPQLLRFIAWDAFQIYPTYIQLVQTPWGNRNFPHTTQLVSSKLEPIRTKEKEAPSERRTRERPSRRSARERKAAEKAVSNFADDLSLLRLREGEREE